jgi:hypothetical protein
MTLKSSVLSYPDRGPWGNARWRGNCSGYVYRDVFEALRPRVFVDPMVGSGTSVEVAREMNIEAYGLDLHSGFNILRQSVLAAVGKPSDLCLAHPPYNSMIIYSGEVWGEAHPDDLSRCVDEEDFLQKLQMAMLNMRDSVVPAGFYGIVIGDCRKRGSYSSYQAECIARMPKGELKAVLIKAQHNVQSSGKSYGHMALPYIMHEYILLWQRPDMKVVSSMLGTLSTIANEVQNRLRGTWKSVVWNVLVELGGKATLGELYDAVAKSAPEKLATNPDHWRPKVRQTLIEYKDAFAASERGQWTLAQAA